jgi:hypothetical protein
MNWMDIADVGVEHSIKLACVERAQMSGKDAKGEIT